MATIIREQSFKDHRFDMARYNEAQAKNQWYLDAHGVRHVISYLTPDGRRLICVFEAPDTEAIRRTAAQLDYEYDRLWTATVIR